MLYVTTRSDADVFTAQKVLRETRGPDGGFYVPFRMSGFSEEELESMSRTTFYQRVAEVLNRLFQNRLTAWDVEFAIGRRAVQLKPLGRRILMVECWHNPEGCYSRLERNVGTLLTGTDDPPGSWVRIAIGVAVLGGIALELRKQGLPQVDISLASGDFSLPVSAWFAREWGFPIGNIVLCSLEQKNLWDLLCHGQMRTDTQGTSPRQIPVPPELELLLWACGGKEETERFVTACRRGSLYTLSEPTLGKLRRGLFASVVSTGRVEETIPAVYRTHHYLLSRGTALAYAGLLDCRARTGSTGQAMVIAEKSPALEADSTAPLLGMTARELIEQV